MTARMFGLHQPGRDRGVVEDTEAAALVGVRMVRAAREVGRQTRARHDGAASLDGGTHRAPSPFRHRRAPGETDLALCRGVQRAGLDGLDVRRQMDQRQFAIAGRQRLAQPHLRQFGREALAQAAVLGHGKAVAAGQGQDEVVGVESVHRNGR